MKIRHIAAVSTLTAVFLFTQICAVVWGEAVREVPESVRVLDNAVQEPGRLGQGLQEMGQKIPQVVDMIPTSVEAERLYSLSAVLMDGDSGRVLYEKDGEAARANASTTKVLTCIVALESSPGDDYVQVSKNAASQPEVKLGIQPGEQYYLEDLLYSLMLKSHNDTAVAIAEHCGGSVEGFARMLNRKAKQIGCTDTYFITPNGLDATDSTGHIIRLRGIWH